MLDSFTVHESNEPEDTRSYLASKNLSFDVENGIGGISDGFKAQINALFAPDLYLAYMAYRGADVLLDTPAERMDYGFSAPLRGRLLATQKGETIDCTQNCTALASPGTPQRMRMEAGTDRLSISVGRNLVRRRMAAMTGAPVTDEIVFDPTLDLEKGPGKLIYEAMRLIAAEAQDGKDALANPHRSAHFEELSLSALILYQPHSHRKFLEQPMGGPASRDVKRVQDYIHANLENPIRLEDLVRIANVPGRTLNDHFRAFTGFSPMAYLRKARLAAVHRDLASGDASSVTEAATRFGFFQVGRFATFYTEAFGEVPSETLARTRRGMGSF